MGVTAIRRIWNRTGRNVVLNNRENGRVFVAPPGVDSALEEWIPWCGDFLGFDRRHILISVEQPQRNYWIWQHWDVDGDYVRYSTDGKYYSSKWPPYYPGQPVPGFKWVDGDRRLIVHADGPFSLERLPGWW